MTKRVCVHSSHALPTDASERVLPGLRASARWEGLLWVRRWGVSRRGGGVNEETIGTRIRGVNRMSRHKALKKEGRKAYVGGKKRCERVQRVFFFGRKFTSGKRIFTPPQTSLHSFVWPPEALLLKKSV